MSGITFSGLASGINSASIVSQLMALERRPETLMQAQQAKNNQKVSEFQKIEDALSALQTMVNGFSTPATFSALKTTVADSSVLTAAASSAATPGTHTVQVVSLAQKQRQVSTGVASNTALIFNTGSFTIDDGAGVTTTVNIAEGQNSLQGMTAAITASGANVSASIINDGTNYRLVINGKDTKNYTLDFSGLATDPVGGTGTLTPSLLGVGDPTYQGGADADFFVDGIHMTSPSDTVTGAISGVTLNLLTAGSTTNVSISSDTDSITKKINDFVAGYNRVMTLVNSQSTYNATTKSAGVLSGDSTVRSIQSQLRSLLTTTVSGATGAFKSLASLGIKSDSKTGNLSVDSTKLSAALNSNYNDVVDLFAHNGDSLVTLPTNQYGIAQQFSRVIETMVHPFLGDGVPGSGLIEVRKKGLAKTNADLDKQISAVENRIAKMQANLQRQFDAMETTVSNLQSQGNSLLSYLGAASNSNSKSSN